jgi:DNA-binding transcriptional LysR family regulator
MDLNRAATFLRVVETGGFTAAAAALGLPTSSVSRSVAKLEQELGVVLLERTTRRVSLTEVGRAYFERVREALAGLDAATAAALDAANEPHGMIRIAVPPDLAPVLGPMLARFLQTYPKIRIDVATSPRPAELIGEHADLAIAFGKLPDSSLVSRRLGDSIYELYASPSYVASRGRPRTLAELARHDAIVLRGLDRWELTGPRGPEAVQVSAIVAADHLGLVVAAALAGLGIALLPSFALGREADPGELVQVLPRYHTTIQLQLVTHAVRRVPHRVALLRDFLVEHMSSACTAHAKG